MGKNRVQRLYAIGHSKWYDPFKFLWNKIVSSRAEKDLETFLKKNVLSSTTFLELGCGTALNLEKIFSLHLLFAHYLGVDFSPDMLKIAKEKFKNAHSAKFLQQDITRLGNIGQRFDLVLSTWVMSHLESPSAVVNAAQKLLKPGGKMFLIFLARPKWYVSFWLGPLAKHIFRARFVPDEEIAKFGHVKRVRRYSANMVAVVEIELDTIL